MPGILGRLWRNERGAVAPTVALSLVGLIAAGGIAFDYARLAAMDTELQQAADQAALAAATQLDRADDSIDRAEASVQDGAVANRLAANFTRFANDATAGGVEIASITFCSAFDDSKADTAEACTETTDPAEARFVWLQTSLRTANYAFTPIVGAISGTSRAEAVAGIESSICNIAPLFVCTSDEAFPADGDIGKGLLMKTGAKNSWFPGNYGYLDLGPGNPGVVDALVGHGLNGCQRIDESNTQPGNKNATDAINTRFDIYAGVGATSDPDICTDLADGSGCPDQNVGKDLTKTMTVVITKKKTDPAPIEADYGQCGDPATAKNAPTEISYEAFVLNSASKGMPRDSCHYTDSCDDDNFGDGAWNRNAYFQSNYGWDATEWPTETGLSANVSRYDVYKWELAHRNDTPKGTLDPVEVSESPVTSKTTGQNTTYTRTRVCAFRKPVDAKGAANEGRRILPVVAANCESLNGKSDLDAFQAIRVFNVFVTEPSMQRTSPGVTDDKEIYGEIIGPAETISGGTGFQYYSRNRPYLIR